MSTDTKAITQGFFAMQPSLQDFEVFINNLQSENDRGLILWSVIGSIRIHLRVVWQTLSFGRKQNLLAHFDCDGVEVEEVMARLNMTTLFSFSNRFPDLLGGEDLTKRLRGKIRSFFCQYSERALKALVSNRELHNRASTAGQTLTAIHRHNLTCRKLLLKYFCTEKVQVRTNLERANTFWSALQQAKSWGPEFTNNKQAKIGYITSSSEDGTRVIWTWDKNEIEFFQEEALPGEDADVLNMPVKLYAFEYRTLDGRPLILSWQGHATNEIIDRWCRSAQK